MPKHRGSIYVVMRESYDDHIEAWVEPAIIGTYATIMRAEEVAGIFQQAMVDAGYPYDGFRFSVKVTTYYDE
jgi:hypothetical protein